MGNEQGLVSYLVPEGDYKIRVDYLGYPYWSATLHVDQSLNTNLLIPHQDVEIGVELLDNKGKGKDLAEVPLTLYTPSGEELSVSTYSDFKGKALFHLPERGYTVAASYQEQLFYSAPFTWQDTTISIQSGMATVAVTSLESPLKDVMVTVCKTDTSELALHDATDTKGEVGFQLVPGDYLFRVDYQGHEYWSAATSVVAFGESDVFIEVGGGGFVLTLLTDAGLPLEKVETFLSTGDGVELNQSALTDKNGQVSYELAAGSYLLKINYLGTTYWSEPIESPAMSELTHIIEHRPVEVSAKRFYQGDEQALKNLQVRLFTPDGQDLKLSEKIGKDYVAHFSLPEQNFGYQVEYLSQLFATGPSAESIVELVIPEGMGVVSVVADDTPLVGIPVSVFSETGTELGISGVTDQDGEISLRLPVGLYQFRAEYNASTYQAISAVIADQENQITLDTGAETLSLTLRSGPSTILADVQCSLYTASGQALYQSASTNAQGVVSFQVSEGEYKIKADYLGNEFWSEIISVPEQLSASMLIEHQVALVLDFGSNSEPLSNTPCKLFTATGIDTGLTVNTDGSGIAYFSLPFNSYQAKVDYLGNEFFSAPFDWFNTTLAIPQGALNIHLTRAGMDAKTATVKICDSQGEFLGLTGSTDSSGLVSFELPAGAYKLHIIHKGDKYWSDPVYTEAYMEVSVEINLSDLAGNLTNNPNPGIIHGKPPEYRVRLASLGSLLGLFANSATAMAPNTEARTFYYLSDHLGTAQLLVDQEQTIVWKGEFKPFGQVDTVINELDNSFRFPGQYFDTESGLHQNWHRYYDPAVGRYVSADPIGLSGGVNLFGYVGGDPIDSFDPKGVSAKDLVRNIAKAIAGPGRIHMGKNCNPEECQLKTLPEDKWDKDDDGNADWGDLPTPGSSKDIDGFATPNGIAKIPNGYDCYVTCDKDGKIKTIDCHKRTRGAHAPPLEWNPKGFPPNPYNNN